MRVDIPGCRDYIKRISTCVAHACKGQGYDREGAHPSNAHGQYLPCLEGPALPVLPRCSRCLVRPNGWSSPRD